MASRPLLKDTLAILNICGLSPVNKSVWSKFKAFITLLQGTCFFVELVLQLLLRWTGWDFAEAFTVCFAVLQVVGKIIALIAKKRNILALLKNIEKFWSWKNYSSDFERRIEFIYKIAKAFLRIYGLVALITIVMYLLRPLLTIKKTLPFETYHPTNLNDPLPYKLMYTVQIFDISIAWVSTFGFDSLFISLIITIVCEIKILKESIALLHVNEEVVEEEDNCLIKIGEIVDHHNLILKCIADLNEICSVLLLNQFLTSVVCICVGLLSILVSGFPPDPLYVCKCAIYLTTILGQLLLYCVAGEYLLNESESVSNTVYQSPWSVNAQPKLRKAYVLIIQRARKEAKLAAGGMLTLNLETFTKVVKSALSFFTFMHALFVPSGNN